MTPTPLEQLTPEAVAKMDGPELWWYALQVMGRKPMMMKQTAVIGSLTYVLSTGQFRATRDYSEWNLFGLAVEWLKGKGCRPIRTQDNGDDVVVVIRYLERELGGTAPDLPTACARCIVNNRHLFRESE